MLNINLHNNNTKSNEVYKACEQYLIQEIEQTKLNIRSAESKFDNADNEELIDIAIMEMNVEQQKLNCLIKSTKLINLLKECW